MSTGDFTDRAVTIPAHFRSEDWGSASDVDFLYGRDEELVKLKRWLLTDRCRLVAISGMGGIGKTTLARELAEQTKNYFHFVIWRSLQDAPPITDLLQDCIKFLSRQQQVDFPKDIDSTISLLISYLKEQRCLVILDNVETILQKKSHEFSYLEGYEEYGKLIQRIGETVHQSCFVVTTREKLKEIVLLEGVEQRHSYTRSLTLAGLDQEDSQEILRDKGLLESGEHWNKLINYYSGNPLALKLVAGYVKEVAEGNVMLFLDSLGGDEVMPEDIRHLLDQQFVRLSILEQKIMYDLAINRKPRLMEEILEDLGHLLPRKK